MGQQILPLTLRRQRRVPSCCPSRSPTLTMRDRCRAQGKLSSAMVISSAVSVDHCRSFRRHARRLPGHVNLMLAFQCARRKVARRTCAVTLFALSDDVRTCVPGLEKFNFAAPEKAVKVCRRLLQARRSPLKPRRRVDPVLRDALVVSPSSFATPVDARFRRGRCRQGWGSRVEASRPPPGAT